EPPEKQTTSEDSGSFLMLSEIRSGFTINWSRPRNSMKLVPPKAAEYWSCLPLGRPRSRRSMSKARRARSYWPKDAQKGLERVEGGEPERRGRPKPPPRRRIDRRGYSRRDCLSGVVVAHHALIDAAVQEEHRLGQLGRRREYLLTPQIFGTEDNAVVV